MLAEDLAVPAELLLVVDGLGVGDVVDGVVEGSEFVYGSKDIDVGGVHLNYILYLVRKGDGIVCDLYKMGY